MSAKSTASTSPARNMGRTELIGLLAMTMSVAAIGVDLMLPALGAIREEFGLAPDSNAVAGLVTAYILGLAASQLVYGILSDRFGRKPVLYAGLVLYIVGAGASMLAPSFEFLLVSRFVWGLGGAGPRTLTLSVVRDKFEGAEMARFMSVILGVFILVPAIAPSIGAILTEHWSWEGTFGFALIVAVGIGIWSLRLEESLAEENRREIGWRNIVESTRIVLGSRVTVVATLILTILFGVFLSYIASSELIFAEVFDRGAQFPIIFGAIASVMAVGMFLNSWMVGRYGVTPIIRATAFGYLISSTVLAAIAVSTNGHPSFWVFSVGLGILVLFQSILIPNLNTVAMGPMGKVAGIASAIIGTFSTGFAAVIGAVVDRTFDGSVLPLSIAFAIGGWLSYALLRLGREAIPADATSEGVARLDAALETPAILTSRRTYEGE